MLVQTLIHGLRQPLGFVLELHRSIFQLVPMWMFPIAIACGNSFILKPSEKDPSCSIRLATILKLVSRWFNVIKVIKNVDLILN